MFTSKDERDRFRLTEKDVKWLIETFTYYLNFQPSSSLGNPNSERSPHEGQNLPPRTNCSSADLSPTLTPEMLGLLKSLLSEFQDLDEKAKNMTRQIEAWAARDETARRLQTIPWGGPLSATAIIATVVSAN